MKLCNAAMPAVNMYLPQAQTQTVYQLLKFYNVKAMKLQQLKKLTIKEYQPKLNKYS